MNTARARLALALYGAMALAAVVWGALRGHPWVFFVQEPWPTAAEPWSHWAGLGGGAVVAASVLFATRLLVGRTQWALDLHQEFRSVLGPMANSEIFVFALSSGVAEELLFRGALMSTTGVVVSSLIFGLVHQLQPLRRYWPWTAWAIVMGFVFGVLSMASGNLGGAILAHVAINFVNLRFIRDYDPAAELERSAAT